MELKDLWTGAVAEAVRRWGPNMLHCRVSFNGGSVFMVSSVNVERGHVALDDDRRAADPDDKITLHDDPDGTLGDDGEGEDLDGPGFDEPLFEYRLLRLTSNRQAAEVEATVNALAADGFSLHQVVPGADGCFLLVLRAEAEDDDGCGCGDECGDGCGCGGRRDG